MPHPMTRLCDRFGWKELNSHSFAPCRRVVDMAGALPRRCSKSSDSMYLCGKVIHVSRREVSLSNKFWARHLVDTVAMWLKCNSTPPFRVDSRQSEVITACSPWSAADSVERYKRVSQYRFTVPRALIAVVDPVFGGIAMDFEQFMPRGWSFAEHTPESSQCLWQCQCRLP
jgi:hypothetical protein